MLRALLAGAALLIAAAAAGTLVLLAATIGTPFTLDNIPWLR